MVTQMMRMMMVDQVAYAGNTPTPTLTDWAFAPSAFPRKAVQFAFDKENNVLSSTF